MKTMTRSYDYIVIGAGSAGCVLANRLSESGKYTVCLLEAGPADRSPLFRIPAAFPYFMFSKKFNWAYHATPDPSIRQGQPLFVPRGKALGGSSSINAMVYVRGNAKDYDDWAHAGNTGWTYADLLPYFKRSEQHARGESELHGAKGPIYVDDSPPRYPLSQAFLLASQQLGYPLNSDFNGYSQEGVGTYQYNIKGGERCGVSRAYLKPAMSRNNITVEVDAVVQSIWLEQQVARGVVYSQAGKTIRIGADKEVLLCAGAINSPQLLMLSGIGDSEHLSGQGIPCRQELPGVGQNLQEHVDACVLVESRKSDGLTTSFQGLAKLMPDVLRYGLTKKGRLARPVIEVGGFIKSSDDLARPDIQLGIVPLLFDDNGRDFKLMSRDGYSCHICILRPKSRGSVKLKSANPLDAPEINFNFFSHPDDQAVMVEGIKTVRKILAAPAFDDHRGKEVHPGTDAQSDESIYLKCLEKLGTVFHPVGTCKMGSDGLAVVNHELKVHGIQRLRVVDASIMPGITSGNTNAPTIAIAEKASDLILSSVT